MDDTINFMDISTTKKRLSKLPVYQAQHFRTPLNAEREIGLWVDRVGAWSSPSMPKGLRKLGLYAAIYVEKGKGVFESQVTGRVPLHTGDVFLLFPDIPTRYYPSPKWQHKGIVWSGPQAKTLHQLGYMNTQHIIIAQQGQIVEQAHTQLTKLMGQEDLAAVLQRKNIVTQLILQLFQATRKNNQARQTDKAIQQSVEFINQNYTQEFDLPQLAARSNLSVTHFRRLFKQYTGRSPRQFITSLRISQAKLLLAQGQPIKKVAAQVGYQDIFYFMRVFKKITGMPPGKFAFIEH